MLSVSQPQPVLNNGTVSIVAAIAIPILLRLGLDADSAAQVVYIGGSIVAGALSIWRLYEARKKVTPLASPKDADGTPLKRAA